MAVLRKIRSRAIRSRRRRPARKTTTRAKVQAGRVPAAYKKVKFGSRKTVAKSLAGVRLAAADIGALLDVAKNESLSKANQLAVGIVGQRRRIGEERTAIRGMMRWAIAQTSDADARRRIVLKAFMANKRELFAVHGLSELAPQEAALFMRSYFAEGGSMQPVAEWLAIAGRALRQTQPAPVTNVAVDTILPARRPARNHKAATRKKAGLFDWVSDAASAVSNFVSDTASAVGDAVTNVVNAVVNAGKSLVDAVAAAVNWTVSQATDLVTALIAAGKSAASILTEALSKGMLGKFVAALVAAGRAVGEVLSWAVAKAGTILRDTVAALLNAGRTVYQIVVWAAGAGYQLAQNLVQALISAGRTIGQVITEVLRLSAVLMKKMVAAVYAATKQLGQILVAIATTAASVIRTVLEGLLAIGVTLVQAVATVFVNVAQAFRRGFIEGLIALGRAPLDILKAALLAGASILTLAFAVFMEIWGGHRPLTAAERAGARKIFGWSIDLDRVKIAVASVPADIVNWLNGQRPFTTMYVINFASNAHITMSTLIHELTHVWQAVVAGPVYMVEALHSQFFGRGYEVTAQDIARANGDIKNLEREQQAVVVERYYVGKFGSGGYDPAVYEQLAKQVYKPLLVRIPLPNLPRPFMLPLNGRLISRVPRLALTPTT